MAKYVCPKCSSDLTCISTKDWAIDPDTGILECPTVDHFFCCTACDWSQDNLEDDESEMEIVREIINLNLENNTL